MHNCSDCCNDTPTCSEQAIYLYCKTLLTGCPCSILYCLLNQTAYLHATMQIDQEHLRIEDDDRRLPDSKSVDWDMPFAVAIIKDAVDYWDIDTVCASY